MLENNLLFRNLWTLANSTSARKEKSNSGPLADHTKGLGSSGGRYLRLQRSFEDKYYTALYYSPDYYLDGATDCSLRLYYYMYGEDDLQLKIYTEYEQNGWTWKERFSESGSLGEYL